MARNIPKTRVVVAGVDITDLVGGVDLHRRVDDVESATVLLYVDRLELHQEGADAQVLTLHIAEGKIA